jgi:hypothetical protein
MDAALKKYDYRSISFSIEQYFAESYHFLLYQLIAESVFLFVYAALALPDHSSKTINTLSKILFLLS